MLQRKVARGNAVIKFDILKAFDIVSWKFLLHVLEAFGFYKVFVRWVKVILKSSRLSIAINGSTMDYFKCGRGVHQGDPLSPILFCFMGEVLSIKLTASFVEGKLNRHDTPRGVIHVSHFLYVDDLIIFCNVSLSNLKLLFRLMEKYGVFSGQKVIRAKSVIYFGGVPSRRRSFICQKLGISEGRDLLFYLGAPIFKGIPKKEHFQSIVGRIRDRLAAWPNHMLSLAGRMDLLRSVFQSMLLFSFHIYLWPRSTLEYIFMLFRIFLWFGKHNERKYIVVARIKFILLWKEEDWA